MPTGADWGLQRAQAGVAGRSRALATGVELSMPENEPILELKGLAVLMGRRPETIRKDLRRNPAAVPPRLIIEGTRLLRWRVSDVQAWLDRRVEASRNV